MKEELYIQLIYKELQDQLSSAEKASLDQWKIEDPGNELIYKSIRKVWEESEDYNSNATLRLDLDKEYARLQSKIQQAKGPAKSISFNRVLLIAASFFLAVMAGNFIYSNYLKESGQAIFATDGNLHHVLSDETEIWLKEGSSFQIPGTFSSKNRDISLQGEAFFSVKADKKNPFTINTKLGKIEVLGTQFHVKEDTESLLLQVQEGIVQLSTKENISEIFKANEAGLYQRDAEQIARLSDVDQNEFAWHSGRLVFKDVPFQKILIEMQSFFDRKIIVENTGLMTCPLSIEIGSETIEEILQSINLIFGSESSLSTDDVYSIKGGFCN